MINNFEPALAALFSHLQAAVQLTFAGTATGGAAILTSVSSLSGLFAGLPVFGPGVQAGTVIEQVDAVDQTVTLSQPVTGNGGAGTFTTGFLTTGRRLKHWSEVKSQPAMFMRRTGVIDSADPASCYVMTTLECEVWLYCNAGANPDVVPDSALAALEKMIRDSFQPDADYGDPRFTLGGLVYWCRIDGRSDISPGDQGGQAIARIPVKITLP